MKCTKCGYEIYEGTVCPICGYNNSGDTSSNSTTPNLDTHDTPNHENEETVKSTYSMKWYKAILVILWLGIIGNAISGILFFTGSVYQGFADKVYDMLPSLKPLDIFSGIFSLSMVIFTFIVWLRLKNYKKHAPRSLTLMNIINTIFLIAYSIALYSIIAGAETTIIYGSSYVQGGYQYQEYLDLSKVSFSASDIIEVIVSIVMTIANYIYFRNRSDLFIN